MTQHGLLQTGQHRCYDVEGKSISRLHISNEQVMKQLGVMPFDEDEVSPENPSTF